MNVFVGSVQHSLQRQVTRENGTATEPGERPNWKLVPLQLKVEHAVHEIEDEGH
jgi:hypothetical protein